MSDTIIALSTPAGTGAIAVIRLSGSQAIRIVNQFFKGKDLTQQASHTAHFGRLIDPQGTVIDEVVVTLFIAPASFTGEDSVEISCHGSQYIVQKILQLFVENGIRLAKAGEFTQRAFLNGKMDLAQAEAVADLIHAESETAHRTALYQMRGGFSKEIKALREQLIQFASLVELELDFGEEDIEFADKQQLRQLILNLQKVIAQLLASFKVGNVLKNGVPTVIAGKPNAGKSTLLNALLNEEKAIVSEIAGTTRDVIEDETVIEGIRFRFIDTAGLRETEDKIEKIGVQRSYEKIQSASLLLYVLDSSKIHSIDDFIEEQKIAENFGIPYLLLANKVDIGNRTVLEELAKMPDTVLLTAQTQEGIADLKAKLLAMVQVDKFRTGDTIVTNARHYASLFSTQNALSDVLNGLDNGTTGDLLAMDIRMALHYLGEITGEITTEDLLDNIFSKFCIGK
jgi:tRNA modification GTPase